MGCALWGFLARLPLRRVAFRLGRRAGAQASPRDQAREAKRLQVGCVVVLDSRGQNLLLPGGGGKLQPLKLADHLEHAVAPVQHGVLVHVLPPEQVAHDIPPP